VIREVGKITAPIDRAGAKLAPGMTARVDVVVRTGRSATFSLAERWMRSIRGSNCSQGPRWPHNFLERRVEQDGKGPVEPGAHSIAPTSSTPSNPINKAQCLAIAQLVIRAADSAWRGRRRAFSHQDS